MPLDPNIPLASRGIAMRPLGQAMGEAFQLQGMQQYQQMNEMRLQQEREAMAARAAAAQQEGQFNETLQSGGGRAAVLERLKGQPELYKRALEHFDLIDNSFKRHMGEVAASVRAFDDSPDAAMLALDELIAQGYDERKLDRYRSTIQSNPESVTQLIDSLLLGSPDEGHRSLVRKPKEPEAFTLRPGETRFGPDGQPVANLEPEPERVTYGAPTEAMVNGRRVFVRPGSDGSMYDTGGRKLGGDEVRPMPLATGGGADEPLIAVMGPNGPVLVRRSQAEGMTPASNREQGRPVTSGDAGRIAELDTALDDLKVLDTTLTETKGATGVDARIGASLPNFITEWTGAGADAKKRQGVIDRVKQVIGKALEGGVLKREDEKKYEKILPTIGDPNDVAVSKLEGLAIAVAQRRERLIDALQDAGYDVSAFRSRGANTPAAAPADPLSVVTPDGQTYKFPTRAQADAFRKRIGG